MNQYQTRLTGINTGEEGLRMVRFVGGALLKQGKINCIVECTPMLGSLLMETVLAVRSGKSVDRVIHPVERTFSDYDDLTGLSPRGY